MKILSPLNDIGWARRFAEAGVDEFYIGFHDDSWTKIFGPHADLNRMSGFGQMANKCSFADLEYVTEEVRRLGKRLFVTLNANCYSVEQLDYIVAKYGPSLAGWGVAGVICSDMLTAERMMECGLDVTVSTMAGVYNKYIAREYVNLGVKRIILPRDLTLDEIRSIVKSSSAVEYEVFHMRNGCVFSDSYCLGFHRPECGSTCSFVRHRDSRTLTSRRSFDQRDSMAFNDLMYNSLFHAYACAMCAVYDFLEMGISSLKIVGRADNPQSILEDVISSVKNLEIASVCSSREEYLSKMVMNDMAPSFCRKGHSCYYPEIRYGK